MSKKKKIKPVESNSGSHIKTHSDNSKPTNARKPLFSFQHLDKEYCISKCDKDEKAAIADCLRKLSELTWQQIQSSPKHGLGSEKITRDAINRPIPQHIKDDAIFLALRFHGKKAMVGYKQAEVLHVIWFDRNFTLYNHGS